VELGLSANVRNRAQALAHRKTGILMIAPASLSVSNMKAQRH
jgi:hypothetical protein